MIKNKLIVKAVTNFFNDFSLSGKFVYKFTDNDKLLDLIITFSYICPCVS